MQLEYWMIAVFIIAAGAWGELRNYMGKNTLEKELAIRLVNSVAADTEKEMEIQRGIGGITVISKLVEQKILKIDQATLTIIGYEGNQYKLPDMTNMSEDEQGKVTALKNRVFGDR